MGSSVDDRGVSPVIGTILMVAIVVVIAATIGVTMLGFSDSTRDLTAPVTYGDNLIENPAFEEGDANWQFVGESWNGVRIANGDGVGGSDAIRLQNDTDYVGQDLDSVLLSDAEYRLCAQSRLESQNGGRAWIGVQHDTGAGDIHLTSWEVTQTEYQNTCNYFETDREFDNISVWAYTEGDVSVLADEFVLQRTQFLTEAR